ncbi:hemolysin family protein [Shewanella sp. C32]|uniref:Polyamine export protein n=1 Tax=Shewanella electrica TaxID=515560 RepID=A0ABT2FPT5_9GAMM|nr:hemolysin family protein [Shewanella electrica]MCH1926774.1 hemolysin family protein [Shewanella electrica]MCS4558335.1 hemolysin family protein [Shewanella electrica]
MSFLENILLVVGLIGASCLFSMSEIGLAAARKIRLRQMADEGDVRAEKVLSLQAAPGNFFTVVQIGLNAVAIMGGIVGESAFTPYFTSVLGHFITEPWLGQLSFALSFVLVTSLFILLADLMPKRVAMVMPERVAVNLVGTMLVCIKVLRPLVWFFNSLASAIMKILHLPMVRKDEITSDDIYAIMDAGAEAGVLDKGEQQMIENVFEMQSLSVTSAMTARESLIFFRLQESEHDIKAKISEHPYSKFVVCDGPLDNLKGYVDAKELLVRVINGKPIDLNDTSLVHPCLIVPDTLSMSEAMEYFRQQRTDFAIVMNEYALVVGIVTSNDLQSAVMGAWSLHESEEQIVARDANSWLVDGVTPISDVMRALSIDEFPQSQNYETVAGFMMYMLRKIPKRTDAVNFAGYKFEVVDIDSYKVDQLLVTRINAEEIVPVKLEQKL